jgi:hypothetical protein
MGSVLDHHDWAGKNRYAGRRDCEAMKDVSRLQRILSIGMLAITMRVELGLFAPLLAQREDAQTIDDELRRVAGRRENAATFRSAQAAQGKTGACRSKKVNMR